jgi:hypothetical protein
MGNAFDKLGIEQNKLRSQAQDFYFWLWFAQKNFKIVTILERRAIFSWVSKNELVDYKGVIRAQVLKHIPLNDLYELIDTKNLDPYPRAMRAVIRQRLGIE